MTLIKTNPSFISFNYSTIHQQISYKIKEQSWIAKLAAKKLKSNAVAIVIGRTIHLHNTSKEVFLQDTCWLKHEMCHLQQFKRYGFFGFIARYLWESYKVGYYNNKYEVEARKAEIETITNYEL